MTAEPRVILVVDDDEPLRRLMVRILGRGYRVQQATSGVEALRAVEATPFQLVVLDFHLPDMSGADVARAIRERSPAMCILFVSGGSVDSTAVSGAAQLRKPFTPESLRSAVDRILAAPA